MHTSRWLVPLVLPFLACVGSDLGNPSPPPSNVAVDGGGSSPSSDAAAVLPGTDAAAGGFVPSNLSLNGIDTSKVGDVDLVATCTIQTDVDQAEDCFVDAAAVGNVIQSDGSKLHVVVLRTLKIEPTVAIFVTGTVPLALVTLGDMTILGQINAQAAGDTAGPGGFDHGGPGAGTVVTGAGASGASYCGRGGIGALEPGVATSPATPAGAYGGPLLIPLVGGSAGGAGIVGAGAGGGAVQLVSLTHFTLSGLVDVGGGGGPNAGTTGQEAGGGGSGGAILIEAPAVTISGTLAANGGGGGGTTDDGKNASPNAQPAPGGPSGGAGGAHDITDGANALPATADTGGAAGGGATGRIRINAKSAQLNGATLSPALGSPCTSQGSGN